MDQPEVAQTVAGLREATVEIASRKTRPSSSNSPIGLNLTRRSTVYPGAYRRTIALQQSAGKATAETASRKTRPSFIEVPDRGNPETI